MIGESIAHYRVTEKSDEALKIALQICEALEAAQEKGNSHLQNGALAQA